ncbi:MAG: hypothetical protein ACIALR_07730, partial [Blastopirellula sp. JB062]
MATTSDLLDAVGQSELSTATWPSESENRPVAGSPPRSWVRSVGHWLASGGEWLFGLVSMIFLLAVLATLPVVNLLSLGYLLEVSGRVARTGRISAGLIGIRTAARLGSIALGTWLLFWPLRFLADLRDNANLIEPGGPV